MAFSFGLGDAIISTQKLSKLANAYKKAPHKCQAFSKQVLSADELLKDIVTITESQDASFGRIDVQMLNTWIDEGKELLYVKIIGLPIHSIQDSLPTMPDFVKEHRWQDREGPLNCRFLRRFPTRFRQMFCLPQLRGFHKDITGLLERLSHINALSVQTLRLRIENFIEQHARSQEIIQNQLARYADALQDFQISLYETTKRMEPSLSRIEHHKCRLLEIIKSQQEQPGGPAAGSQQATDDTSQVPSCTPSPSYQKTRSVETTAGHSDHTPSADPLTSCLQSWYDSNVADANSPGDSLPSASSTPKNARLPIQNFRVTPEAPHERFAAKHDSDSS